MEIKSFPRRPDATAEELWDLAAESEQYPQVEQGALQSHLDILQQELEELSALGVDPKERADVELQIARTLVGLGRGAEAWVIGRRAFDVFLQAEDWESAVDACDVLFLAEQPQSLCALGQGIWLAVTYPIDPELSVELLSHVVEETPDASEGAVVAAATALFLADLRAEGQQRENLLFFAGQMLGAVARRQGRTETQTEFDRWMNRMGLRDPERFLARLRELVEALVQDDWWFDRAHLQARLPLN